MTEYQVLATMMLTIDEQTVSHRTLTISASTPAHAVAEALKQLEPRESAAISRVEVLKKGADTTSTAVGHGVPRRRDPRKWIGLITSTAAMLVSACLVTLTPMEDVAANTGSLLMTWLEDTSGI